MKNSTLAFFTLGVILISGCSDSGRHEGGYELGQILCRDRGSQLEVFLSIHQELLAMGFEPGTDAALGSLRPNYEKFQGQQLFPYVETDHESPLEFVINVNAEHPHIAVWCIARSKSESKKETESERRLAYIERLEKAVPAITADGTFEGEQVGARQPTTAPDSKSEGNEKPNPESEGRSQ